MGTLDVVAARVDCLLELSGWDVRDMNRQRVLPPGFSVPVVDCPRASVIFSGTSSVSVVAMARR